MYPKGYIKEEEEEEKEKRKTTRASHCMTTYITTAN